MTIDEMLTETSKKFNQGFITSAALPMVWPWQVNRHSITQPRRQIRRILTFATIDDHFVPLVLIWWQAQEQPLAENPLLPPRILTSAYVKLIRDINAAQRVENLLVMRT